MAEPRIDSLSIYKLIGERIRDERRKRHLTQDELASRVGLKRTSITNVERGRQKLLVHTLLDIANSLDTSPARLLAAFDHDAPLTLPPNLSASVRNWIVHSVGVSTAHEAK
jgi:transcriptional regulator with XRE-family HTH domain